MHVPAILCPGDPVPASISEGKTWLRRTLDRAAAGECLSWSIDIREGPSCIGSVGLSLKKPGISFVIGRAYWGCGYATEAAGEVLSFGLDVLGLPEVGSEFVADNSRSCRVHAKLGFRFVENFADESDGAECERHVLYR